MLPWPPCSGPLADFLYSVGGIHAGASLGGACWFIYYTIDQWVIVYPISSTSAPVLATSIALTLMSLAQCAIAVPWVRRRHHNWFEYGHRYIGWAALVILWAHVVLKAWYFSQQGYGSTASILQGGGNTWSTLALSILVWHPWIPFLCVYKQRVTSSKPDKGLLVIKGFQGHAAAGSWGRISVNPWGEWHPFALISPPRDKRDPESKSHMIVMAKAGDWTAARMDAPPDTLWIRRIKAPGFMYTTRMWKRIVCFATGAGIAPVLPVVLQGSAEFIHAVWVVRNPRNYGEEVWAAVEQSAKVWVHDVGLHGHLDPIQLALQACDKVDAEAVFVISNLKITFQMVRGLRAAGVRAFGAIWDS